MTKTTTGPTKPAWVHVAWLVVAFGTVVLLIWIVLGARALSEFTRTVSPLWILAAMLAVQVIVAFAAWWTVRRIRTLLTATGGALLVGYLMWAVALPPVAPWAAASAGCCGSQPSWWPSAPHIPPGVLHPLTLISQDG